MASSVEKGLLAESEWQPSRASYRHRFLRRIRSPFLKSIICTVILITLIFTSNPRGVWNIRSNIRHTWAIMSDSPPPPRAVDPSIYSAVYPEQPHPKVVEVAELMTELYKLFISMRYINAEDVAFPPHTENPVNITEAARYGLTKDVVDMMQMVPYYTSFPNWNHGSDAGEFIFWGEFHDMRGTDADWYQTVVDPFYALSYCPPDGQTTDTDCPQSFDDENGIYIRPHYAVINRMGNHGSVLIFDTKDCK